MISNEEWTVNGSWKRDDNDMNGNDNLSDEKSHNVVVMCVRFLFVNDLGNYTLRLWNGDPCGSTTRREKKKIVWETKEVCMKCTYEKVLPDENKDAQIFKCFKREHYFQKTKNKKLIDVLKTY